MYLQPSYLEIYRSLVEDVRFRNRSHDLIDGHHNEIDPYEPESVLTAKTLCAYTMALLSPKSRSCVE